MSFGNILHEGLEVASHLGGAIGNASSTILDASSAINDIEHHDYLDAIVETGETIYHGAETYGDVTSGDWF